MSCDCIPGKFQCREATRLWDRVNGLYQSGYFPGSPEYDAAAEAYREHEARAGEGRENDVAYQYAVREGD